MCGSGNGSQLFGQNGHFLYILNQPMDASLAPRMYKDMQLFQDLEKVGVAVQLPWDKITTVQPC